MKIRWKDLNNNIFVTSPVILESEIYQESLERSDKTWKRYDHWERNFPMMAATKIIKKEIPPANALKYKRFADGVGHNEIFTDGKYYYKCNLMVEEYFIFDHLVAVYMQPVESGWYSYIYAKFQVIDDDNKIIFDNEDEQFLYKSWQFISKLSGQYYRREMRIKIAQNSSHIMAANFNYKLKTYNDIIPLNQNLFIKSDKRGYIIMCLGKYIFSDTNKTGYYKVIREKENYKIVKLIEEYKIIK